MYDSYVRRVTVRPAMRVVEVSRGSRRECAAAHLGTRRECSRPARFAHVSSERSCARISDTRTNETTAPSFVDRHEASIVAGSSGAYERTAESPSAVSIVCTSFALELVMLHNESQGWKTAGCMAL